MTMKPDTIKLIHALTKNTSKILVVESWEKVFFVKFEKGSPTFISKRKVLKLKAANAKLAREQREERSSQIKVSNIKKIAPMVADVHTLNTHSGTTQIVRANGNTCHMTCTCKDFQNLQHRFGQKNVACKHIYSVLHHFDYKSLSQWAVTIDKRKNKKSEKIKN